MDENRNKVLKQKPLYASVDGFVARRPSRQYPERRNAVIMPYLLNRQAAEIKSSPSPIIKVAAKNPELTPAELIPGVNSPLVLDQPSSNDITKKKRSYKKKAIRHSILLTLAILVGVGGFLGIKGIDTVDKVFHGNVISDATAAFQNKPLKGESTGRVNILLAGDSSDDPGHQGAQLTDSILLLSIDTQNHTAFLLSIPRDLWVNIPGLNSYQKINAANEVTNFSTPGYPKGGMGELEQIIKTQFGIPVDYYGLMDYGAFKDSVNAVGGVTINIQSSDPRGIYDPNTDIKLPNGPVALNGEEALNLARARGDGYGSYGFPDSDFDRTEHQRQLFKAVASKAATAGVLANPVKISDLISTLGSNFQTDMTLQNVLRLTQISKSINLSAVQSYAFSSTLSSTSPDPILETYTDPNSGQEALIPSAGIGDYSQLQQYYDQITSNNPIVKENPSVVILNGSDVVGLASGEKTTLEAKNFTVSAVADANNEYPGTMIVDNTNGAKPASLKSLQQQFPGTTVTTTAGSAEAMEAKNYTSDFVVILGQNWDTTSSQQ
jgi:LCP family protein required for cell wall assembly